MERGAAADERARRTAEQRTEAQVGERREIAVGRDCAIWQGAGCCDSGGWGRGKMEESRVELGRRFFRAGGSAGGRRGLFRSGEGVCTVQQQSGQSAAEWTVGSRADSRQQQAAQEGARGGDSRVGGGAAKAGERRDTPPTANSRQQTRRERGRRPWDSGALGEGKSVLGACQGAAGASEGEGEAGATQQASLALKPRYCRFGPRLRPPPPAHATPGSARLRPITSPVQFCSRLAPSRRLSRPNRPSSFFPFPFFFPATLPFPEPLPASSQPLLSTSPCLWPAKRTQSNTPSCWPLSLAPGAATVWGRPRAVSVQLPYMSDSCPPPTVPLSAGWRVMTRAVVTSLHLSSAAQQLAQPAGATRDTPRGPGRRCSTPSSQ